ncbi:hypothetical protein [Halorubrum aidingense]|uniref:hypothetical protein n=1 Tax=Halorubrum aidingense TaxID=368623 RepID=UPI001EFA028F|nr:hypothetical protein [Halorubrum aidingense]
MVVYALTSSVERPSKVTVALSAVVTVPCVDRTARSYVSGGKVPPGVDVSTDATVAFGPVVTRSAPSDEFPAAYVLNPIGTVPSLVVSSVIVAAVDWFSGFERTRVD